MSLGEAIGLRPENGNEIDCMDKIYCIAYVKVGGIYIYHASLFLRYHTLP